MTQHIVWECYTDHRMLHLFDAGLKADTHISHRDETFLKGTLPYSESQHFLGILVKDKHSTDYAVVAVYLVPNGWSETSFSHLIDYSISQLQTEYNFFDSIIKEIKAELKNRIISHATAFEQISDFEPYLRRAQIAINVLQGVNSSRALIKHYNTHFSDIPYIVAE